MKLRLLYITALISILTACSTGRGIPAPIETRDGGEVVRNSRSNTGAAQDGEAQQGVQQGRVMPPGAQPNVYPAQSRTVITGPRPTPNPVINSNSEPMPDPISDSVPDPVPSRAPAAIINPAPQLPTQSPPDRSDIPASVQQGRQPAITAPTTPAPPALPPRRSNASNSSAPAMALLESAESAIAAGDLERAAALCERALRITPRDGYLWYRLAAIRYQQRNYDDATGFARRAASFAGPDNALTQDINVLLESAYTARGRAQ